MGIQSWAEVTFKSLQNLWANVIGFLPSLVGALIIIVVGLIVAAGLRVLVERLINSVKLDSLLRSVGLGSHFERAGFQVNSGKFFGLLVYWFLLIVFILAATDVLGLWGVSLFLRDIVSYIPNIIVAVLIMVAALILANFLRTLVRGSVMSAKLHAPKFLGTLSWWTVVIFGFLAALIQLGIATAIINTLVTGFIAMLALAGGIAFGLGGKDYAAHLLEKLREGTED